MCAGGGCSSAANEWPDSPAVAVERNSTESLCRDWTEDEDGAAPGSGVYVNVSPVA